MKGIHGKLACAVIFGGALPCATVAEAPITSQASKNAYNPKSKKTNIRLELSAVAVENGRHEMDGTTVIKIRNIGSVNCYHSQEGFRRNLFLSVKDHNGTVLPINAPGAALQRHRLYNPVRGSLTTLAGETTAFTTYLPAYFSLKAGEKYTVQISWKAWVFASDDNRWFMRIDQSDLIPLSAAPFEFRYKGQ